MAHGRPRSLDPDRPGRLRIDQLSALSESARRRRVRPGAPPGGFTAWLVAAFASHGTRQFGKSISGFFQVVRLRAERDRPPLAYRRRDPETKARGRYRFLPVTRVSARRRPGRD